MGRPQKAPRTGRPGFLTYGSGIIAFGTSLENQLLAAGGSLEAQVVYEDPHDSDSDLVFLLFYKDSEGHYFDVVQRSTVEHKIYKTAGHLIKYVGQVRLKYPDLPVFTLPELNPGNVLMPGDLRK